MSSSCKCKSYSYFFPAKVLAYMPYLMIKIIWYITNDIVRFERQVTVIMKLYMYQQNKPSRNHTYIILTPLNPTFI